MNFQTSETKDVVIFALKGRFMAADTEIRTVLRNYVERGFTKVVIDFAGVRWANSAGIGVIVAMYHTMKRNNGELVVARLTEKVHYYFNITKLDTVFKIYDSLSEAVVGFEN